MEAVPAAQLRALGTRSAFIGSGAFGTASGKFEILTRGEMTYAE